MNNQRKTSFNTEEENKQNSDIEEASSNSFGTNSSLDECCEDENVLMMVID